MLPLELVFLCNSSDVQEVLNETGEAELSLDDVTVEMSGQEVFRDDLRLFPADFLEKEVRDKNPAALVVVGPVLVGGVDDVDSDPESTLPDLLCQDSHGHLLTTDLLGWWLLFQLCLLGCCRLLLLPAWPKGVEEASLQISLRSVTDDPLWMLLPSRETFSADNNKKYGT